MVNRDSTGNPARPLLSLSLIFLVALRPALPFPPPVLYRFFLQLPSHSVARWDGPIGNAVGDRLACLGGGLASGLAAVGLVVEVSEEDDKGDGVANQGPVHPVWELAVDVEGESGVANGDVELDLINGTRNVCLPHR